MGLLVRFPSTATATTWLAAAVGYLGADLATGSTLVKALLLNSTNSTTPGAISSAGRAVALDELLMVSDEALYRAKTNQRNTVVVAEIAARD